jgi:cytochrome d ubiquinol oxidase subunit I
MTPEVVAARWQFAFTIMFHYLFPVLTMGLGVLIAVLKTVELRTGQTAYGAAARFWARIFAITFAAGVVTGIPMEFQFGTNWSRFSRYAGPVVGQTLFMEGVFAFFAESSFLGIFLFGERRVGPRMHWLSAVMVAFGAVLSGFFIVATNAWMQHPVGYRVAGDHVELTSLWALLTNPYVRWQYPHVISGSLVTASMVMAGTGAFYLLQRKHEDAGRIFVRVGVIAGAIFSMTSLFRPGFHGENLTRMQPAKVAAMEGLFKTQNGRPLAIIGMPDRERQELMDPIYVPGLISFLAYGNFDARVTGLNDIPPTSDPPVEIVYYAYHIMVGLGHYLHRDPERLGVLPVARYALPSARDALDPDDGRARSLYRERGRLVGRGSGSSAVDRVRAEARRRVVVSQRHGRDDVLHAHRLHGTVPRARPCSTCSSSRASSTRARRPRVATNVAEHGVVPAADVHAGGLRRARRLRSRPGRDSPAARPRSRRTGAADRLDRPGVERQRGVAARRGGALVAAFPTFYAASFSGFYLALMLVLWLLLLRGIGIEFRHQIHHPLWEDAWDVVFSIASLLLALLFGVALGNVLRGVPFDAEGEFRGTFAVLLNGFSILGGVLSVVTLGMHGACWAALRPTATCRRARGGSRRSAGGCRPRRSSR